MASASSDAGMRKRLKSGLFLSHCHCRAVDLAGNGEKSHESSQQPGKMPGALGSGFTPERKDFSLVQ